NGVWKGSSQHVESSAWHQSGDYGFKFILGGDGMRVQIDSRDNATVYTGYQFGHYYRMAPSQEDLYIHPKHELGEEHLRWNWQTPFLISRHQEDVLYMGSNKFHRSLNKGEDWKSMSVDLTKGAKTGDVPFGTLSVIDESPLNFGWIAVGSDDGLIHVSKDGGQTWSKRSSGYPTNMWITKIEWSAHEENLIYMTCNGYRFDHFEAYVYKSKDAGKTWTRIGKNLPKEAVNVVLEDKLNPELVFVGTDNGVYCSLDGGQNFMAMSPDLPSVPVHDMVISEKAEELVIATHGRSFYIAPIHLLRETSEGVWMTAPTEMNSAQFDEPWNQWFTSEGPFIDCEAKLEDSGEYTWKLLSDEKEVLLEGGILLHKGYNLFKIEVGNLRGKLETERLVLE
ncbi:MAG: WD40/YVTN/BNR-like repeat-containing protein, partial [Flavobacteriales bacterium]